MKYSYHKVLENNVVLFVAVYSSSENSTTVIDLNRNVIEKIKGEPKDVFKTELSTCTGCLYPCEIGLFNHKLEQVLTNMNLLWILKNKKV